MEDSKIMPIMTPPRSMCKLYLNSLTEERRSVFTNSRSAASYISKCKIFFNKSIDLIITTSNIFYLYQKNYKIITFRNVRCSTP